MYVQKKNQHLKGAAILKDMKIFVAYYQNMTTVPAVEHILLIIVRPKFFYFLIKHNNKI